MKQKMLEKDIFKFLEFLYQEERSQSTIEKYRHDLYRFFNYLPPDKSLNKKIIVKWKEEMRENYAVSTVNAMLAALNGFLDYIGRNDCRVKPLKQQRIIFRDKTREMTKAEYIRLLQIAKDENTRLYYIMETLSSTGIRISELPFITVEAIASGRALVQCKGKTRIVLIGKKLKRALRKYCKKEGIYTGAIFVTRTGNPVNRSNVWREMKMLCDKANVDATKVFPHNFRHLFAVCFYKINKDIAKLADLLGHASIETTRIYIMESREVHENLINQMNLVL